MYMYAHPGKKLNFMGNEIGHFREWDEKREQDLNLLDSPAHQDFHRFMADLNRFYSELPAYGGKGGGKFRALPDKTSSGNRAFEFTLASFSAEYYLIL